MSHCRWVVIAEDCFDQLQQQATKSTAEPKDPPEQAPKEATPPPPINEQKEAYLRPLVFIGDHQHALQ